LPRPVLQVIAASTRPGRRGIAVARWLQQYAHQHTRDWSATVSRADAFVFVTPEYNRSFPAALKNALDFLSMEWADKPVGLASYGGVSAGLRAATALKPVLAALRMVPVVEAVSIPFFAEHITADDEFVPTSQIEAGGKAMLNELTRLATVLRDLRETA